MEKRHRVFIAINLPEEIKKELFSYSEKYKNKFDDLSASRSSEIFEEEARPHTKVSTETSGVGAKWTVKDNLHITLEFLGALTDEEIGEVCVAVKGVAERHDCFSLSLTEILYGPPKKVPPRMIWAEGEKSKELSMLREDLENSLTEKVRFVPENRTFAPHITLARISAWEWKGIEPDERPEINEKIDLPFTVESIDVMESMLKRGGPVYTILESHNLKE